METSGAEDNASIRRYLLGDVSEAERERVERRLMLEDDFHDRVLVEEDELLDAYLDGDLSASDAARFTSVFLAAPERRARLRFARTLRGYAVALPGAKDAAAPPAVNGRAWQRWALVAVAATLLVGFAAGLALLRTRGLERELAEERAARETEVARVREAEQRAVAAERERERASELLEAEQKERERLAAELARRPVEPRRPALPPAAPSVTSIILEPGRVRGAGDVAHLAVRRGIEVVRLRLADPPDATGPVTAVVRDPDGIAVWSGRASRSSGALVVYIPAAELPPNDYQVVLESGEAIARYYFRLSRR